MLSLSGILIRDDAMCAKGRRKISTTDFYYKRSIYFGGHFCNSIVNSEMEIGDFEHFKGSNLFLPQNEARLRVANLLYNYTILGIGL